MSCSLNPMSLLRRDKQVEPETNVEAEVPVQAKENSQARSLKEEPISQSKKIPAQRMQSRRPRLTVEPLPEGWTVDRHPVAKWGMSLPTVMSNVLDSAQSVEYWEEVIDLPTGYKLPLKRAKVYFQIVLSFRASFYIFIANPNRSLSIQKQLQIFSRQRHSAFPIKYSFASEFGYVLHVSLIMRCKNYRQFCQNR